MTKIDLSTPEGQYKAGLYCAKHYFSSNPRIEGRCSHLDISALIHRIDDARNILDYDLAHKTPLYEAWYAGINEGKRIR